MHIHDHTYTASASHWAPLPRSTLTPLVSSGWQSVSPASPESCVPFLLNGLEMGFMPEFPVGGRHFIKCCLHIWGSFWHLGSFLRLTAFQTINRRIKVPGKKWVKRELKLGIRISPRVKQILSRRNYPWPQSHSGLFLRDGISLTGCASSCLSNCIQAEVL